MAVKFSRDFAVKTKAKQHKNRKNQRGQYWLEYTIYSLAFKQIKKE